MNRTESRDLSRETQTEPESESEAGARGVQLIASPKFSSTRGAHRCVRPTARRECGSAGVGIAPRGARPSTGAAAGASARTGDPRRRLWLRSPVSGGEASMSVAWLRSLTTHCPCHWLMALGLAT